MDPSSFMSAFGGASGGGGGGGGFGMSSQTDAQQNDTISIHTGDVTPTVGAGPMNLGGSEMSWMMVAVVALVAVVLLMR